MKLSLLIEDAQKLFDKFGDLDVFISGEYALEPIKGIANVEAISEDDEDQQPGPVAVIELYGEDDEL